MSELELYESTWKLATRVNQTPFVPKAMQGKPEHVLACVLYGRELGLGPMQSLNSVHVIEGRAAASPELMRALVAKAGHRIDVTENSNEMCTMKGSRADTGAEATVTWSMADARNAGLTGKDNWKKYPRAMLAARATSELCRLLFPDVIAGLSYTPEELESLSDAPAPKAEVVEEVIIEAEVVEPVIQEKKIVSSSGKERAVLGSMIRHGSPDREAEEPGEATHALDEPGSSAISDEDRAIQLITEAFPGAEVVEPELVDSLSVEQRRAEIKTWGAWARVRAVAIPIARGEGLVPPSNIDDLVTDHVLYTAVAKEFRK